MSGEIMSSDMKITMSPNIKTMGSSLGEASEEGHEAIGSEVDAKLFAGLPLH